MQILCVYKTTCVFNTNSLWCPAPLFQSNTVPFVRVVYPFNQFQSLADVQSSSAYVVFRYALLHSCDRHQPTQPVDGTVKSNGWELHFPGILNASNSASVLSTHIYIAYQPGTIIVGRTIFGLATYSCNENNQYQSLGILRLPPPQF